MVLSFFPAKKPQFHSWKKKQSKTKQAEYQSPVLSLKLTNNK
jgi:hypothetical protein